MLAQLNETFLRPACMSPSLPGNLHKHLNACVRTHKHTEPGQSAQPIMAHEMLLRCVCVHIHSICCVRHEYMFSTPPHSPGAYAIMHAFSVF